MGQKDEIPLKYEYFFIAESHIFYIAVLIIVLVGVLLIVHLPKTDPDTMQAIFTALLTSFGSIVGFYFGQKPISDMVSRLEEKDKEMQLRNMKLEEYIELKNEYKNLIYKTISKAKKLNGENK